MDINFDITVLILSDGEVLFSYLTILLMKAKTAFRPGKKKNSTLARFLSQESPSRVAIATLLAVDSGEPKFTFK